MVANKLKVLGFAGSLRTGSYNKALLRAAENLLPENLILEIYDIDGIPPFNQDNEQNMPVKVKEFKSKIRGADALLIATPEYNYSVPGVLKNAIDCASRPYGDNPFALRKTSRPNERICRYVGGCKSSIPSPSDICIFEHVSAQWARGHSSIRPGKIRCQWEATRREH